MSASDSSTPTKTCLRCGAPIVGRRSDTKWCTRKCGKAFWDETNQERKAEHDRLYRQRHGDQLRATERQRRAENPEPYRERDRLRRRSDARRRWWATYERDKAVKAAGDRAYREANQSAIAEYLKQWAKDNPRRVDEYRHRRSAHKAAAAGSATAEKIQARIDYYGGRCWICGARWQHVDHVKPLTKGGSNWPANLRPACKRCNSSKKSTWPYTPPAHLRQPHRERLGAL